MQDINLRTIIDNDPHITKINDSIYSKDKTVLIYYMPHGNDRTFVIPPSVKKIGRAAFYMSKVERVICNDELEIIDDGAFCDCGELKEISMPDTVCEIGREAFCGCKKLIKVKLPNGITEINDSLFKDCTSLHEIELSSNIRIINSNAFSGCKSLKKLHIPDEVKNSCLTVII